MSSTNMRESREFLLQAFQFAFGAYVEQESKKADVWRNQTLGQLYKHLEHEVFKEIRGNIKNNDRANLVHNASDAVMLSVILMAKVMDLEGLLVTKK